MGQNNYEVAGFKSKVFAIKHIFEMILQNPACAGVDGTVNFMIFGNLYQLKPKKKKQDEE